MYKVQYLLQQISCQSVVNFALHVSTLKAKNIENITDTFHLYFDNDIMKIIVDYTNIRINNTIVRLEQCNSFSNSDKYTWVQTTEKIKIDAVFGLIYLRDLLSKSSYD